ARYYDPTIGRFITEDSYGGDDNDPMTLNRYIYGRDNPERYVDPNGHRPLTPNDLGPDLQSMCAADPAACTSVTSSTSSTTSVVSADQYYTTYQKMVTTTTTTCFEGYCTSKTATNGIATWTSMNPGNYEPSPLSAPQPAIGSISQTSSNGNGFSITSWLEGEGGAILVAIGADSLYGADVLAAAYGCVYCAVLVVPLGSAAARSTAYAAFSSANGMSGTLNEAEDEWLEGFSEGTQWPGWF
ncbi:MAG TPA: RHS repeat-associated core domain-containing protein, partial [Nitrososphaerales archaeon]|nr:RHS repeat-associated core domain-containing protein [Nitrososphaerales archaeon]